MKSLNTYNYREELYMKPISYQVTISDNDKVIKIEDDGDLIAELSFAIDGNILFLNGKDGLEVAQVELPISLAEIVKQRYNEQTKEIELSILKTNGETVVFGLDVAELVNVYTAGDGIDITDNVISIKIKDDKGPLHVDKHGLCIDMNTLATSDDVEQINAEIEQIKSNAETLTEHVNNSIDAINTNVANGFATINESISILNNVAETTIQHLNAETNDRIYGDKILSEHIDNHIAEFVSFQEFVGKEVGALQEEDVKLQQMVLDEQAAREERDSELNAKINVEMAERIAADESLQNQIGDVAGALEGSIAEEIGKIKEEIGDVKGELEGSIADAIVDLQEQIGDVKGELEGSIADAITDLQEQIGDVKGELEGSIADAIVSLETKDAELNEKIDAEVVRATDVENTIKNDLLIEVANREKGDAYLQAQLGDGFLSVADNNARFLGVTVTKAIQINKEAIDNETQARIEGDNKTLNSLAIEKQERKDADDKLNTLIVETTDNLASSIKLVKDENNNLKYTLFVNGVEHGVINIPADKMLEKVEYDQETNILTFYWNTDIPQSPTQIDMTDLVDEYFAGNGLSLEGHTFKVNVAESKYIDINENGSVEFVGAFVKPDGTNWKYDLIGKNGFNNGKFIDFTSDYESYNQHIQETYAPLTYVDSQDELIKSTLIGTPSDSQELDTLYGLRAAIAKSEEVTFAKIAEEQTRAENAENDLDNRIETSKADLAGYVNQEISKVNDSIAIKEEANNVEHSEMAQNIRANSDILASLTNGEQTGVVDKLDRQFHEVTRNIDENQFEGLIKSLMDRINTLESTISILVGGVDVNGSVANVVSNCLNESKAYTDEKSVAALENAVKYANETFQVKGDYITEIDAQYITENELASYDFVNNVELTNKLNEYYTKEVSDMKYQPKGDYINSIPSEYVTETELAAKNFATVEYVNGRDENFLSKDMADLLYAPTDVNDKYVTTNTLLSKQYATETYVNDKVSDKLTKAEAVQTYQPIGNYLSTIPSEYVTDSELLLYGFATKNDLNAEINNNRIYVDNKTHDMLTKTEAAQTYQLKGEYVTNATLKEYNYATKTDLFNVTNNLVTKGELSGYQPIGNYVTVNELDAKNYVNTDYLSSQNYVSIGTLIGVTADMLTKTEASSIYATKENLDKYISNAFTADNIVAGSNIQLSRNSNNVTIAVKLSDSYKVEDTFNQNLPTAGNTLDLVSERLSEAVKKLYDTTDGELF